MKTCIDTVTKCIGTAIALTIPFIAVWLCYIMTAHAFQPKFVFGQDWFQGLAGVYYLFSPLIVLHIVKKKES